MEILDFFERHDSERVICLGRFDGVHLGHQSIINKGLEIKNDLNKQKGSDKNVRLSVFLFRQTNESVKANRILTFEENALKLKNAGVDEVIYAYETQDFYNTCKDEFLSILFQNFSPVFIVCGEDYTFGKNREGNAEYLKNYCADKGVFCTVMPIIFKNGEKISSTLIKKFLNDGDIEKANMLLGGNYFLSGKVLHGRAVGRTIGFPTLNVEISPRKAPLKRGVYATETIIDGNRYKSITNYGSAPTFDENGFLIETFVLDFRSDVYGKEVIIEFLKYLREDKKFANARLLQKQLDEDIKKL